MHLYGGPAVTVRCFLFESVFSFLKPWSKLIFLFYFFVVVVVFFPPGTENDCEATMADTDIITSKLFLVACCGLSVSRKQLWPIFKLYLKKKKVKTWHTFLSIFFFCINFISWTNCFQMNLCL